MKQHYETLGVNEGATQEQIQMAYDKLSKELNPENNNNQDFFREEYEKVQQAYNALSQSSILKNSESPTYRTKSSNRQEDSSPSNSSDSFTVTISKKKMEELKRKTSKVDDSYIKMYDKSSFSWWSFDDEYITGWQYIGRNIAGTFLAIFLVGFYLHATTAYKRSKSLGNSESACRFFGVWGFLSLIIGLTPAAIINFIPNVYLWASNGHNPYKRN